MKRLFKFRYPKIAILLVCTALSYIIFSNNHVENFILSLGSFSYLGIFIAGIFFSFGFSTPFAIGFFVNSNPTSILLAAVIGGFGALISDLLIFKIIRFSFMDEFKRIERTRFINSIKKTLKKDLGSKINSYLIFILAGIVIASPLPDELGVSMLAGLSNINVKVMALISFIMNSLGILIILLL